jgi:hypothetical protein
VFPFANILSQLFSASGPFGWAYPKSIFFLNEDNIFAVPLLPEEKNKNCYRKGKNQRFSRDDRRKKIFAVNIFLKMSLIQKEQGHFTTSNIIIADIFS